LEALNVFILPALAILILGGCAVMAWLVFRPQPIKRARKSEADGKTARPTVKKAL